MDNDYLKSIETMLKLVQPDNNQSNQEILVEFQKHLDNISKGEELALLQQLIKVFKESPEIQLDKKQIFNEIRQKVNLKCQPNQFLDDLSNKNSKNVGVSLLKNDGILTDQMTRKILEIKHVSEIQKTLFEYCAIAGQTNLLKQFHEETNLLKQDEVEKQFQMTIYSEKTRKKALKIMNQFSKKVKANLLKMNMNSIRVNWQNYNIQSQCYNDSDKMKIKYLKTITIKITKVNLSVNQEFLQSIKSSTELFSSQQLAIMAENPKQFNCVVKCEIFENPQVEEILLADLLKDSRLQKYEAKWKAKMSEIKEELQNIKSERQQQKIQQTQSQILFNATSEFQFDLNYQIQYKWT